MGAWRQKRQECQRGRTCGWTRELGCETTRGTTHETTREMQLCATNHRAEACSAKTRASCTCTRSLRIRKLDQDTCYRGRNRWQKTGHAAGCKATEALQAVEIAAVLPSASQLAQAQLVATVEAAMEPAVQAVEAKVPVETLVLQLAAQAWDCMQGSLRLATAAACSSAPALGPTWVLEMPWPEAIDM